MIIILLIIMVIVSKLWQVGGFKKSKLKFCANERGKKKTVLPVDKSHYFVS